MTIFEQLSSDHHQLRLLLEDLLETNEEKFLHQLKTALLAHGKAEEFVLYARLRQIPHRDELADLLSEEHQQIDSQVEELEKIGPSGKEWKAKLEVLKSEIEAHLSEEESGAFPILELALTQEESERLAFDYRTSRDDVIESQRRPIEKRKAPEGAPSRFTFR